jgi:hypothetical protein
MRMFGLKSAWPAATGPADNFSVAGFSESVENRISRSYGLVDSVPVRIESEGEVPMGRLVAVNSVSLDGVTQGLGGSDQDGDNGFEYPGWGLPYPDQVMGAEMGASMGQMSAMLLGRRRAGPSPGQTRGAGRAQPVT